MTSPVSNGSPIPFWHWQAVDLIDAECFHPLMFMADTEWFAVNALDAIGHDDNLATG
jgi:hypothetical protein